MTTLHDSRPRTPVRPPEPAPAPDLPEPPRISFVQIVASALAAVTSTIALSYFGVAGTIIGAAAASVVTIVGNVLYTRSILRAQRLAMRPMARKRVAAQVSTDSTDEEAPSTDDGITMQAEPVETSDAPIPTRLWTRRRIVVAAFALFAIVLAAITAVELFLGKPISDALTGQEGSGSSVSQVITGASGSGTDRGAGTTNPGGSVPEDNDSSTVQEDATDPGVGPEVEADDPSSGTDVPEEGATTDPDDGSGTATEGEGDGSGTGGETDGGDDGSEVSPDDGSGSGAEDGGTGADESSPTPTTPATESATPTPAAGSVLAYSGS